MDTRESVIEVNALSKLYQLGETASLNKTTHAMARTLKNGLRMLTFRNREKKPEVPYVWALRNVSFDVKRGEVFGIIGHNGSGKSTLLKLLSRITFPTEGTAATYGRVASLLEVGTGFNGELTGYDNIYLNGCILGMSRKEIDAKLDAIISFSGIEKFIRTPIKRLSSGMQVRLGFAVASYLEPDVMIIDEVLAVGDADFQKKCMDRMEQIRSSGCTILFVSHNMDSVAGLCDRVMWLNRGEVKLIGKPRDVIQAYLDHSIGRDGADNLAERPDRQQSGDLHVTRLSVKGRHSQEHNTILLGEDAEVTLSYRSSGPSVFEEANVWLGVIDPGGRSMVEFDAEWMGQRFDRIPGEGQIVCRIPKWPFTPGVYSLSVRMSAKGDHKDGVRYATSFVVQKGDYFGSNLPCYSQSLVHHPCEWEARDALASGVKHAS
jgi:lipopolysaccharide transport system ATP-binding protein